MALPFLKGADVSLRPLRREDADGPYADWFNDPEVCRGNGHHYFPFHAEAARVFIEQVQNASNRLVLAMELNASGQHIGNIELGKIDWIARRAEFAIVLGDRAVWGQGLSKQAAVLLLDHAFFSLNLNRVSCGTFRTNIAMQRLAVFMGMSE